MRALRIAVDGARELAGWWRDDAGHVRTIAGAALVAGPPRVGEHHRPRDGCRS